MQGNMTNLNVTYNTGKLNIPVIKFDQTNPSHSTLKSNKAISHWSRFEKFLQANFPNRLPEGGVLIKPTENFIGKGVIKNETQRKKPSSAKSVYDSMEGELVQMRRDSLPTDSLVNINHSYAFDPLKEGLSKESFEDERLLLRGFQSAEMLDKMLMNPSQDMAKLECHQLLPTINRIPPNTYVNLSCEQLEKLEYHRAKLKNLLEERCYFGLRRECCLHINSLNDFVLELEALSKDQSCKVLLHASGASRNIIDIYFAREQTFLSDLDRFVNRWPSIIQKVNRMLGVFHMGWDAKLESLLSSSEEDSNRLMLRAFLFTRSVFNCDMLILCSKDQQTIPSEVIENFYKNTETFNEVLIKQNMVDRNLGNVNGLSKCLENVLSSSTAIWQKFTALNTHAIFDVLAKHQGGKAAGRILDVLVAEWRNCDISKMDDQVNWLTNILSPYSLSGSSSIITSNCNLPSTSDYFTNSELTNSEPDVHSKESYTDFYESNADSTFQSELSAVSLKAVLTNIIQSNQSSLLRHLFALARLETLPFTQHNQNIKKTKPGVALQTGSLISLKGKRNLVKSPTSRSVWSVYKPKKARSENSSHLERTFWHSFWRTTYEHLCNLSFYCSGVIPQNCRMGTLHFLPDAFALFVQSKMKELVKNAAVDLCTEGFVCVHNFSQKLFEEGCQATLDRQFCCFLSLSNHKSNLTVPLVNGCVGTTGGKLLSNALETSIALSAVAESINDTLKLSKAIMFLQCNVDTFVNWGLAKENNFLAFGNLPLYITIGLSDLYRANELLECVHFSASLLPIGFEMFWCLPEQKNYLQYLSEEMPKIIYAKIYKEVIETMEMGMPKARYWRRKKKESKLISTYKELLISEVISPKLGAFGCVAACPVRFKAVQKLGDSVANAWMDYILSKRYGIKFSPVGVCQFRNDFEDILKWLKNEDEDISSIVRANDQTLNKIILDCESFAKLNATLKFLANSVLVLGPRVASGRNRVHPINNDAVELGQISVELTENEKDQWRKLLLTVNQQSWPNILLAPYLLCCS